MYLFLSIILSTLLGFILWMLGPYGGLIAFGIVVGSLFRGIYILNKMHKAMSGVLPYDEESKDDRSHMKNSREYKRYLEGKSEKAR
ncbi:hypothetical protein LCM10_03895 [Rossellomorea aquimaris]|uniref:hypothetical protein n=1 Tax=Rossellomorea aquimaris TaxID=189382 RepID=UPI001CD5518D|nr:hypothetical protein [Rossellomorea aquimaris]MCA1054118.1 hypothetical protein [Rossellomorea aquimaris]